ncbi:ABC transporter ATP-binding protein [Paenibacillus cymbidii]|uniref:ABC transporter ATP-binding protein n=1 Tax=Paenibacillus cymbidii TaxID=1639034 RepID=UPI001081DF29|nr:ATP-binding cassette domain-containing protein [Paenibacillus cymbidii]
MQAALQLDQVMKKYGSKLAVNGISFEVRPGEVFGLLGANGAGKTTTMRMTLGLIYPDGGRILWNGKGYSSELSRIMGYLPEERGLYPKVKVSEQIVYLAELRGMARRDADRELKRWLDKFGVPEYYNQKVEELSKGNQQKIQFIAAVIHNPDILILDEAFSGLDPVNADLLKTTVRELRDQGKSLLFSSHRMDHVEELCENIVILQKSNTLLGGNLKQIKKAYPRERIILETEGAVEGLADVRGVARVERTGRGYEIFVTDADRAGGAILELAMRQSIVNRYQIMEPTLHEIFVKLMGERHE